MAQDITLCGADYADVPSVELPKTGGGTASFVDISGDTVTAGDMLDGVTAHNASGNAITGSISSKAAATYNTSTSDRTISAGQYLSGAQTIKAVTTANITAANVKYNVNAQVGDANSAGRIKNITGTFTGSTTVSSGQTAAAAAQIRSGYSAWVNGAEVKGSLANYTGTVS